MGNARTRSCFRIVLLLAAAVSAGVGQADEPVPNASPSAGSQFGTFRLYQLSVFQSGGQSYSGGLDWTPSIALSSGLNVLLRLGGGVLRGSSSNLIGLFEAQGGLGLSLTRSLTLEFGGGIQSWMQDSGGTAPDAFVDGVWKPQAPWLGFVDRFYAGYQPFFAPSNLTHEIHAGIGIAL